MQIPHWSNFIHVRSRADLPHLGFVVLLVLGIILGVYLALQPQIFNKQAAEGSLVDIKFIPESMPVSLGRVYEAKIAVNPKGQRVTGMQLNIGYNPGQITILETRNEGFLPISLRTNDDFKGNLSLIYGGTVGDNANQAGMVATLKFKVINTRASEIKILGTSVVTVSSSEENALTGFSVLKLEEAAVDSAPAPSGDIRYPDNLLLEKAFRSDSEPFVQEFRDAIEPLPELKPERVEPSFSGAYVRQLGRDIFIEPVVALNQVIEEKAEEILKPQ